jgi:hypothetical protein
MRRRTLFTAGTMVAAGAAATAFGLGNAAAEPTDGWTATPYTYSVQKPWNLREAARYRLTDGVHKTWVYDTDEPFEEVSSTDPRTELRFKEEYATGSHMWGAQIRVPTGSVGACVAQIVRIDPPSGTSNTDLQLRAFAENGGTLRRYTGGEILATGIYDTWTDVKIAHLADTGSIEVYVNDTLKLTTSDRGPSKRHFKCGVYGGTGRVEAKFQNIAYWTR